MDKRNLIRLCAGLLSGIAICGYSQSESQTNSDASADGPTAELSALAQPKRAPWQERMTLGPGDVVNFALFGSPEQDRQNVPIGPDGRVSFLQARNIVATGLTIDELRSKFDEELGTYYRTPRTIITPAAYHSKKFYVLGAVGQAGVYTLNRPLTAIEAIAEAGGLRTGVIDFNTVELADLSRSFLVRDGDRVDVDFERLFQHGDLSQNVALEPGDYLYFASSTQNEIFVLGAVFSPGVLNYTPTSTVVAAITLRGGFAPKAWQSRVLVVRGSLNNPETFVVNTKDILAANNPDFRLQPRDIVYVSERPWARAEELLDSAAKTFIRSAIVTYTGLHVDPIITDPVLK